MPVINVKSAPYNAFGDAIHDDSGAIQNAFNDAFGTSGSPHGSNTALNSDVYFPAGNYLCNSLHLTKVVNGRIFGDNLRASTLIWSGGAPSPGASIISTDGFTNSIVENLGFNCNSIDSSNLRIFNLDWQGDTSNGGGLSGNTFFSCFLIGAGTGLTTGIAVAPSNNGGTSNTFFSVAGQSCCAIKIIGSGANGNQMLECDFGGTPKMTWVAGGTNTSLVGCQWSTSVDGGIVQFDSGSVIVAGCRCEQQPAGLPNWSWLNITAGSLIVNACGVQSNGSSGRGFVTMAAPASVVLDGVFDGAGSNGKIGGTGTLEIHSARFVGPPDPGQAISGFTGSLALWRLPNTLYANLPATPHAGMEANITDGDNTHLTYLGTTESGGGTRCKKYHYNGTAWALIGI
jgi:hypothetical protein